MFESHENIAKSTIILKKPVTSYTRMACVAEVYIMTWSSLIMTQQIMPKASSLVNRESTQLYPGELKFEANWYFCWISSDRTVQMEMFAHFIHIRLLVPFNKVQSVVPSVWCLFHLLGSPLIKYSLLYQMHDVYVHLLGVHFNKVQYQVCDVYFIYLGSPLKV